jgi:hypothetical protein
MLNMIFLLFRLLGKFFIFIIKLLFKNVEVQRIGSVQQLILMPYSLSLLIGLWKLEKISFSFHLDMYTPRIEIDSFGYAPASWMGWVTLGSTAPLLSISIEGKLFF